MQDADDALHDRGEPADDDAAGHGEGYARKLLFWGDVRAERSRVQVLVKVAGTKHGFHYVGWTVLAVHSGIHIQVEYTFKYYNSL